MRRPNSLETVVICVVLGLLGTAASVNARSKNTSALVEKARSAFAELSYERALDLLIEAEQNQGNSRRDLVRIYALSGLCLLSLRRHGEAQSAFRAALSLDPTYRLDREISPVYQKPFQQVLDAGVEPLAVDVIPPEKPLIGEPVKIRVELVADPANLSDHMVFYYRLAQRKQYISVKLPLVRGKRTTLTIPGRLWSQSRSQTSQKPGSKQTIYWYAKVFSKNGGLLLPKGDPSHPISLIARAKITNPAADLLATSGHTRHQASGSIADDKGTAWYKRWWVWALVGGVALAAGTTTAVFTLREVPQDHRSLAIEFE